MWPYGQTPPLEKFEQPDLKHPRAMPQNDICPQNSPRGGEGFASWPTDYNLTSLTLASWLRTTQNWSFLCYNSFLIITGNKKMTGSPPKSRACALILPLCPFNLLQQFIQQLDDIESRCPGLMYQTQKES